MDHSNLICNFIRTDLVGEGVVVESGTPFEKLGLDSFGLIEIILFIERQFGVILPDNELTKENLFSADTLAACVRKFSSH